MSIEDVLEEDSEPIHAGELHKGGDESAGTNVQSLDIFEFIARVSQLGWLQHIVLSIRLGTLVPVPRATYEFFGVPLPEEDEAVQT